MKFSNKKRISIYFLFLLLLYLFLFVNLGQTKDKSIRISRIYCYSDISPREEFLTDTVANTRLAVELELTGIGRRFPFDPNAFITIEYTDGNGNPFPISQPIYYTTIKCDRIKTHKVPDNKLNYPTTISAYLEDNRQIYSEDHAICVHSIREPVFDKIESEDWSLSPAYGPIFNHQSEKPIKYGFTEKEHLEWEFSVEDKYGIDLNFYGIVAGLETKKQQRNRIIKVIEYRWEVEILKGECLIVYHREKEIKYKFKITFYSFNGATGKVRYTYGTQIKHEYIPRFFSKENCSPPPELDPRTLTVK